MDSKYRIRISSRERELLVKYCKNHDIKEKDSFFEIYLTGQDELEKIVDELSNAFLLSGLNKSFEPNPLGQELEDLNDKFIQLLR